MEEPAVRKGVAYKQALISRARAKHMHQLRMNACIHAAWPVNWKCLPASHGVLVRMCCTFMFWILMFFGCVFISWFKTAILRSLLCT